MPWNHSLPQILATRPHYETEIERVATHFYRTDERLVMIDVGANVGDTIARLPDIPGGKFLCVEGSPRYSRLLGENYAGNANVVSVLALAGDNDAAGSGFRVEENGAGTGHVVTGANSETVRTVTLDSLIGLHPEFAGTNFLKIDTDGFEMEVLTGAIGLLRTAKPCLHIELYPRYWRDYGRAKVQDAMGLLAGLGYPEVLAYDNCGVFVFRDNTAPARLVVPFADYALRAPTYYNLVAFHGDRKERGAFFDAEAGA